MNTVNRFFRLACTNKTPRDHICNEPLGDIQLDMPNTSRRYCRNCKTLMEYVSDGEGRVTKEILPESTRVAYTDSIAVVEVQHAK